MKKKIDFLAIGDVLTDAFIELQEAEVIKDVQGNQKIIMPFGEKIPYKSAAILPGVGNGPNAAVAASRLGLTAGLVAITGQDDEGEKTLRHFQKETVLTDFITAQPGIPTNYHYVLRYGAERTILIKHEKFNYVFHPDQFTDYEIGWIYLTTIADGIDSYYDALCDWLDARPEIRLAFQPGTFQIRAGIEKMKRIYARSNAFFCNKDEARKILSLPDADYPELHAKIRELGPEIVCITDGPNGATISDTQHGWFMPMYPDPKPPVDRTGAGDSCSSTTVVGIAQGKDLTTALSWGLVNSMSVVQEIGAQAGLLSPEKIEEWLAKAPTDFKPQQLW